MVCLCPVLAGRLLGPSPDRPVRLFRVRMIGRLTLSTVHSSIVLHSDCVEHQLLGESGFVALLPSVNAYLDSTVLYL